MEQNHTTFDPLSITPEQLAAMQAEAMAKLPTVLTKEQVEANLRREAKEEAEQRKRLEEKKRRDALTAKTRAVAHAIVAALCIRCPDRKFFAQSSYGNNFQVREKRDDDRYSHLPDISVSLESSSRYSYSTSYTGKTRVVVGSYGDKTSFPMRKDGSHSYDKIVNLAALQMENEERRDAAQKSAAETRSRNEAGVKTLRDDLDLSQYYGPMQVSASSVPDRPVMVELSIKQAMTEEEARRLHAALVALGYVKAKEGV